MKARNHRESVITTSNIERAEELHESLVSGRVSARDVPAVILEAQELYKQALIQDQQKFNPEVLSEPYDNREEVQAMKGLLYKFVHDHLEDSDFEVLASLNFLEADHMRAYMKFETQAIEYAKFIRDYLLKLKIEISVKAGGDHGAKKIVPAFYKYGEAPSPVKKIQQILSKLEDENIPVNIFRLFSKVYDVFAAIKPSSTRPAATAEFYNRCRDELNRFGFIPVVAGVAHNIKPLDRPA